MTQIPQLCRDGTGSVPPQEQLLITPVLCHWEGSDGCNKPSQITHYYHRYIVSQELLLPMYLEAVLGSPATHPSSNSSSIPLARTCRALPCFQIPELSDLPGPARCHRAFPTELGSESGFSPGRANFSSLSSPEGWQVCKLLCDRGWAWL